MVSHVIRWVGHGLNHDFCPSFNKYVYWLKRPIGWVISAILFSAMVGLLIGPQGFVLMWSLIAFLVVGAIWPWLGMKGIGCRLEFDTSNSAEQQPTSARLIVTNGWPIPVFGLTVEGQFLQDIFNDDDKVAIGLKRIPAWSESEFKWDFKPERRGVLPQEPPVVATGFPFGLYQSQKTISLQRQIIVWPKCETLLSVHELDGVNFNIEGGLSDRPGHDGDVIGTRPYRHGDSTKHVNWAKTASAGKLVVLERQTAAQKSIRIVIDLAPQHQHGFGSRSSYEWGIRIAATIAKHLHLHQSQIRLSCTGLPAEFDNECVNARGLNPILDFLAMLPTLDQLDCSTHAQNGGSPPSSVVVPKAKESIGPAAISMIRADEEVFWIGSPVALSNRKLNGKPSRIQDILLAQKHDEAKSLEHVSSRVPGERSFVVNDWTSPADQIVQGWEGLCCDS